MKRWSTIAAGVVSGLASAGPARAQFVEPGWSTTRLDLDVTLLPEAGRVEIKGEMTLVYDGAGSEGPIIGMNTRSPVMQFTSITGEGVASASLNDSHPQFTAARIARIQLALPASSGDELILKLEYEGESDSAQVILSDEIMLASWVELWYPIAATSMSPGDLSRKAPGRTTFRMPSGWRAVTNGRPIERRADSEGVVEVWESELAVARSFVAGAYTARTQEVDGREIGVYLLSEKPIGVERQTEMLAAALAAQETRFGPYPYPTYAIAEIPQDAVRWYAASEQGFIMALTSAFSVEHGNLPLWAHEMAHGWWGNLVRTEGTGGKMVSEALAQYSAVVAIETIEGREEMIRFLEFSRSGYSSAQCATGYFGIVRQGGDKALAQLASDPHDHNLSDSKGMWFYHMLRGRVGDEVFFGVLRDQIDRLAGQTMSLDGLRAAFLEAAPDAELERFFADWLDRAGAPILDVSWMARASAGSTPLRLAQVQDGEAYALDVELEIQFESGATRRETATLDQRERTIVIDSDEDIEDVIVDPDRRLLIWRPEYGERPGS